MGSILSAAALFAGFQIAAIALALGIQSAVEMPISGSLFLVLSLIANTLGADRAGRLYGRQAAHPPGVALVAGMAALLGLIWVIAWIAVWVLKAGDPGAALAMLVQGQTSFIVYGAMFVLLTPIIGYYFRGAAVSAAAAQGGQDKPGGAPAD